MSTFAYPLEQFYKRLEYLLNPEVKVLLGLGNTSSWPVEAVPPAADMYKATLDQLFVYFEIKTKKAARRLSGDVEGSVNISGANFLLFEDVKTIQQIRENRLRDLYLELEVKHNDLYTGSFRSAGIFVLREIVNKDVECTSSFNPTDVITTPLYYEYFRPVIVQEDVTQQFKVVIRVH